LKEVETSLSRFDQNGIQVKGVILNSIFRRATGYQDYGYYEYERQPSRRDHSRVRYHTTAR
ncbi:hypothetical protein MJL33_28825, partial [Salmonella enterica subsp. enterica serovar Kentucky]|nr:hypothetical protein [Salmonella enterica subsp. enterica serovar Kentucky]